MGDLQLRLKSPAVALVVIRQVSACVRDVTQHTLMVLVHGGGGLRELLEGDAPMIGGGSGLGGERGALLRELEEERHG